MLSKLHEAVISCKFPLLYTLTGWIGWVMSSQARDLFQVILYLLSIVSVSLGIWLFILKIWHFNKDKEE